MAAKDVELAIDPFDAILDERETALSVLSQRPVSMAPSAVAVPSVVAARLHGFDGDDHPLLSDVPGLPHELIRARTTVSLRREQIGASVVLVFENGDLRRPIVLGVIQDAGPLRPVPETAPLVSVDRDDDRIELTAERQIVLRCGEASITLTRAGKVIIKGTYVLSRSSGYNKIKGAAVDIN
jgi:hypothetical protein